MAYSLTSLTMLLWWIHHHSHKCLYQLSPTCEQKLIIKKTTYLQKKSMWNQNGHLYDQSLLWCTQQARTQALPFLGKRYAFLVSPRQKPSWRRLNTLWQKQYLVGEVGVKLFTSSLVNKLIRIEWASAIRLPTKLMDVTSSMRKKERVSRY